MTTSFMTTDSLLAHWQGHRRLTRKVIEAFPDIRLFTYSIGDMRPFAELSMEMIRMAAPGLRAVITGKWQTWEKLTIAYPIPELKTDLLQLWDDCTGEINSVWEQIAEDRFYERITSMAGHYEGPKQKDLVSSTLLYLIDNEIHHRAQGYVYLRSLEIEPRPFGNGLKRKCQYADENRSAKFYGQHTL